MNLENVIMYELSALGFGPFFEEQIQSWNSDAIIPARIAAEHRGGYEVWSDTGSGPARLAGRLRHRQDGEGAPAVGDWVGLMAPPGPDRTTIIDRLFARRTVFTRGAAGREALAQVVAANVDLVFVVCGLDEDFNLRRIERYLARIWASGAAPAVILNKADLRQDVGDHIREVERLCAGVPVHATSALRSDGLAAIQATIHPGMTAAFVGSSGAGKSSLINAMVGEVRMATGETRASDGRGCHITTHRQLVFLPAGGLLLDTPGMRELQILDDEGLSTVFDDITARSAQCRFTDCRHDHEPGCAVKAAIAAGALAAERLEHFQKLEREAQAYERRHDKRLQRQSERVWGQLHDEAARLREWKGGK
ncbi:MAG TPA: ribosome small subunit-dependent GTPase A [Polyangia bacterium]